MKNTLKGIKQYCSTYEQMSAYNSFVKQFTVGSHLSWAANRATGLGGTIAGTAVKTVGAGGIQAATGSAALGAALLSPIGLAAVAAIGTLLPLGIALLVKRKRGKNIFEAIKHTKQYQKMSAAEKDDVKNAGNWWHKAKKIVQKYYDLGKPGISASELQNEWNNHQRKFYHAEMNRSTANLMIKIMRAYYEAGIKPKDF